MARFFSVPTSTPSPSHKLSPPLSAGSQLTHQAPAGKGTSRLPLSGGGAVVCPGEPSPLLRTCFLWLLRTLPHPPPSVPPLHTDQDGYCFWAPVTWVVLEVLFKTLRTYCSVQALVGAHARDRPEFKLLEHQGQLTSDTGMYHPVHVTNDTSPCNPCTSGSPWSS